MAASSGAASLEAAAVVSEAVELDPADLAVLRDFGQQITVFHARPDGALRAAISA
jgi:hypothetical protein